jgi:exodeoxyribonuclease V gamma subunit
MLQITVAMRIEELLERLLEQLAAARARPGWSPFDPTHLVVPDRHVETWIKLALARATGLCAGLECATPRRLIAGLVEQAEGSYRLLDRDTLAGLLLGVLLDREVLAHPDLTPVGDYLSVAGEGEDARAVRLVQLAAELAQLFLRYDEAPSDLLSAWRAEKRRLDGETAERWQRHLWLALFGPDGVVARAEEGNRWVTLGQLVRGEGPLRVDDLPVPAELHVFGSPLLSPAVVELLAALAARVDVHCYAPAPCAEQTASRPDLVARWGAPALAYLGRIGRRLGAAATTLTAAPPPADCPLLTQLQHDLWRRAAPPPRNFSDDDSITFLACPSIRRECEAIATAIWRCIERDRSLRFNQIAVLLPQAGRAAYQSHLAAAFREASALPHHVIDRALASDSQVAEAIGLLLELPRSGFTRSAVLRLLTHPACAPGRAPGADRDAWWVVCERLGIIHGADHTDHLGTYIPSDRFNWDQGLRRLALGAFMTGERSGDERAFELAGERYLPEELTPSSHLAAGEIGLLVRSLLADVRFAARARLPIGDWARLLGELVVTYIGAPGEAEQRDLARCLGALADLGELPLGAQPVPYRVAAELLSARLQLLGASRGDPLADGVVVAGLSATRPLPFSVIFLAGLGEGRFPATDRPAALDLGAALPGGSSPTARERDELAFLQAILCARRQLFLSWVARDQLTGEALAPSSVVLELQQSLGAGYLEPWALASRTRVEPLRRFSGGQGGGVASAAPEAALEAQVLDLGQRARQAGLATAQPRRLLARLPADTRERLAERLRLPLLPALPPAAALADDAGPTLRVTTTALRRFLECPLQGYARFWLRWDEDADPDGDQTLTDEPLATDLPTRVLLLREVIARALVEGVSPEPLCRAALDRRALRGVGPLGLYGEVDGQVQVAQVERWWRALGPLGDGDRPPRGEVLRFGAGAAGPVASRQEGPLLVPLELGEQPGLPPRLRVEICGRTEPLVQQRQTSLVFVLRTAGDRTEESFAKTRRDLLRAFLDHVLLTAAGLRSGAGLVHLIDRSGSRLPFRLAPLADAAAARAWLVERVRELCAQPHGYLLPFEAAILHRDREPAVSVGDWVGRVRWWRSYSSRYGPVRRLDDIVPPPEDEARRMIERRLGAFRYDRRVGPAADASEAPR